MGYIARVSWRDDRGGLFDVSFEPCSFLLAWEIARTFVRNCGITGVVTLTPDIATEEARAFGDLLGDRRPPLARGTEEFDRVELEGQLRAALAEGG